MSPGEQQRLYGQNAPVFPSSDSQGISVWNTLDLALYIQSRCSLLWSGLVRARFSIAEVHQHLAQHSWHSWRTCFQESVSGWDAEASRLFLVTWCIFGEVMSGCVTLSHCFPDWYLVLPATGRNGGELVKVSILQISRRQSIEYMRTEVKYLIRTRNSL